MIPVSEMLKEKEPYICVCCNVENVEQNEMHEKENFSKFSDCYKNCTEYDVSYFGLNNIFVYCYF